MEGMMNREKSFNWLKDELRKGLEVVMETLPDGEDPILLFDPDIFCEPIESKEISLVILDNFVRLISAFSSIYPLGKIREIFGNEDIIQQILQGNTDAIVQEYLD
jgi:hypothetical protein